MPQEIEALLDPKIQVLAPAATHQATNDLHRPAFAFAFALAMRFTPGHARLVGVRDNASRWMCISRKRTKSTVQGEAKQHATGVVPAAKHAWRTEESEKSLCHGSGQKN